MKLHHDFIERQQVYRRRLLLREREDAYRERTQIALEQIVISDSDLAECQDSLGQSLGHEWNCDRASVEGGMGFIKTAIGKGQLGALSDTEADGGNIDNHWLRILEPEYIVERAIEAGRIDILEFLHKHGWDMNEPLGLESVLGFAFEVRAREDSNSKVIHWLLDHGVDVSQPVSYHPYETLIERACKSKASADVIEKLIRKGVIVQGSTALCIAAENNQLDAVRLLIDQGGADVDFTHTIESEYADELPHRKTALVAAAKNGHDQIVRCLLDEGARKDLICESGLLPREIAAKSGHLRCVELLDL